MSGLRDRFPARSNDPLHRVRSHVDRRSGANDPARQRRKQRETERAPFVGGSFATVVATNTGNVGAGSGDNVTVTCPAGTTVTGGGGEMTAGIGSKTLTTSAPSGNGWTVGFFNSSGSSQTITAYAICAKTG